MKICTILLLLLLVCTIEATEQSSRKRRVRHRGSIRHGSKLTDSSTGDGFGLKTNGINESPNENTSVNEQVQSTTNVGANDSQWDSTFATGVNTLPGDNTFITGVNGSPNENTYITGVGNTPGGDNTYITGVDNSAGVSGGNTFITGDNSSPGGGNTYITGVNNSPGDSSDNTFANGVNNSPSETPFLIRVTEPENENTATTGINEPQTENTYLTGVTQPQSESNNPSDLESAGSFHFDLKTSLSGHDSHHHPRHGHDAHHHAPHAPHLNLKFHSGGGAYHATPLEKLQLEYGKEKIQSITVTKEVPVVIHKPYPVPVEKKVPFPVKVPYPVPVHVYNPVPVPVQKDVPYVVEKPVPYPVKVPYEKPVPYPIKVPVEKPVPYPVKVPVTVTKVKKVPVPYPVYVERKVPVYITQKGKFSSSQGNSFSSHSSPLVFKGSSFASGGLGSNSYKGLSFGGSHSGSSTGGSSHGSGALGLESGTSIKTYSRPLEISLGSGSFGSGSLTYGTGGKGSGSKGTRGNLGGELGSNLKGSKPKSTSGLKTASSNVKYSFGGTSFKKGNSYAVVEDSGTGNTGTGQPESGHTLSFPSSGSSSELGSSSGEIKTHTGSSSISINGKPIPTFGAGSSNGLSDTLTAAHTSLSYGSGSVIQNPGGIESSYMPSVYGFSDQSPSLGAHSGNVFNYGGLGPQHSSQAGIESGLLFTHQNPSGHNLFGGTTSIDQPPVYNQHYGQPQGENNFGGQSHYGSNLGGEFKGNFGDQQIIYGQPAVGNAPEFGHFGGNSFNGHTFTSDGSFNGQNSYAGQYGYDGSSFSSNLGNSHSLFNNDGGISLSTSISVSGSDSLGLGSNNQEQMSHPSFSNEPNRFQNQDTRFQNQDTRFQNEGGRFPNEDSRFSNESPRFPNEDIRFPNAMSRFTNEDARFGPEQSPYAMYHNNPYEYPPYREQEARERKSFRDYMLK